MTPRPEPETREAKMRQLEQKRAADFNTFLASLERLARFDALRAQSHGGED